MKISGIITSFLRLITILLLYLLVKTFANEISVSSAHERELRARFPSTPPLVVVFRSISITAARSRMSTRVAVISHTPFLSSSDMPKIYEGW